jgi:hypothetical protein
VGGATALTPMTATNAATAPATAPTTKAAGNRALGNGLGRLVAQSESPQSKTFGPSRGPRMNPNGLTVRDAKGRVMVQLTPQAGVNRAAFRKQAEAKGLDVKATDSSTGTLEGFVPLSSVNSLAALKSTGTLAASVKPFTRVGKATSQGVVQQRVDKVQAKGIDGKGITIAALSDSYDESTVSEADGSPLKIHAAQDVKSGDLPGKGNAKYPTPVVNLEDSDDPSTATDEGRAMLQITHDIAPASKLCFASAFNSEIDFADNIRKLADKKGKCGADVLVDDVGYFDEPMFSDGIIADAIDDVAAKGAHYFSSAGNDGEDSSWNSKVHLVPAAKGLKGTNLDFSQVDPSLYDGGLQDMNPGSGIDVAQDAHLGSDPNGAAFDVQWNDPTDLKGASFGNPYYTASGSITAAKPATTFTFKATSGEVGQQVEFRADGVPSGSTDVILEVTDPDGNSSGEIDTSTSPEIFATTIAKAGNYKIKVTGFDGATGPYTVDVRPITAPSRVTTDFNVLMFDADGNFIGDSTDQNILSGRPMELASMVGPGDIQLVISRSGTGPFKATRLRDVIEGDATFTEYSDPLSPAIYGHPAAAGATAVAAFDPFRSYLPEAFTSPGGKEPFYFDVDGNPYKKTQVRQVPQVAGTDFGNTTFFTSDTPQDSDSLPNFGGTSAAAPHAAAIGALVLQKAGGPKSLTPSALRKRLEGSTYSHDLDPMVSGGSAKGLTVTARGNQGREGAGDPGSMIDPNFFRVSYTGTSALKSLTFYGETASPTALGKRNPPKSDGIVFDKRTFTGDPDDIYNQGFPFTIGSTSGGLSKGSVTSTFSVPGGGDSVTGQYRHLTVSFASGLKKGQALQFGVDRDLAVSGFDDSSEGNGADELGGSIFIPQDTGSERGMVFVGTLANGKKIVGTFDNRLGQGYSPVDGFGLVDAQKAVFGSH